MRELKFRAWDKTRNIYGEVLSLEYKASDTDERFCGHAGRLSLFNIKNEHDYGFWGIWIEKAELEQFTGLKDKNGKEIYEGDIVKYKLGTKVGEPSDDPQDWDEQIKPVSFINGEFTPRPCGYYPDDYWYGYKYYDFEVLGNIHENPELLL